MKYIKSCLISKTCIKKGTWVIPPKKLHVTRYYTNANLKKKFIDSKLGYILIYEPYTCINKYNLGKTQQQKNKSQYDKKKSDTQFVYNKNRKQCLINIKKTNKRPSQKSIDKYKLTESEIQKHLVI